MASSSVQLHFAAEFATFLVAAAGLAVIVLRAGLLTRARLGAVALGAGFCGVAAAAVLHGSLLVERGSDPAVIGLSIMGLVLLLAGSTSWEAGRRAQGLLWLGLALLGAGTWLDAVRPASDPSVALLGTGALALGAMLVTASRRAIAARVVSSAAAALLLLVLILSVALSQVLSSTVRDDAVRRLDTRAVLEATNATAQTQALLTSARQTKALLEGYCGGGQDTLACIQAYIPALSRDFFPAAPGLGRLFVAQGGFIVGQSATMAPDASPGPLVARSLASSLLVSRAISTRTETSTVAVVEGQAVAVVAEPTAINQVSGASVVAQKLGDDYLQARSRDDPSLSLALFDAQGILGQGGAPIGYQSVRSLVGSVLAGTTRAASASTAGRFVAVQPVSASGERRAPMALVAATPTTVVDQTRASLFRTLFLIALGGTVLALVFTAFVGDRIGAGLRRLTLAVDAVQRGDPDVRVGFISDDEVGVLGGAFDFMAASIEDKESALRRAADDEARLRNRLEAVVAGMSEALVAVDANGLITDFNRAAEELVGIDTATVVGRPLDQVINLRAEEPPKEGDGASPDDGLGSEVPRRRLLAQGWLDRADGEAVPVSIAAGPLLDSEARAAGGVYVLRDLRREREVERMKTEFLSRIGHELRTPLTGIMGFAELLSRRGATTDRASAWPAEILVQAKRLLRTVEILEFFASTGSGHFNLDLQRLDLPMLLNDLRERWNQRLPNGHSVVSRVGRQLPPVLADRRWVTVALDELVDNAVRFSPGGGDVVVAASRAAGMLEISVSDKGKGMSADETRRVVTEFVQGDGSDTRQHGGLGLGLSMVQQVALSHGGRLLISSKPGKGSKFSVLLPDLPTGSDGGQLPAPDNGPTRRVASSPATGRES